MIEPQICHKEPLTVVGLEASFISGLSPDATNAEVIGPLWDRLVHSCHHVPNRVDSTAMFGVIFGRPEEERSHRDELQYIAGVPVRSTSDVPDGMVVRTVAEGLFAVFTHRGPINNIIDTVGDIYRTWLPQSDYQHSNIADVELYDHRFDCGSNDSEMEYLISIEPKASQQ